MNNETKTKSTSTPDVKTLFVQFETLAEEYLGKKAPALPENAKEMIVKYSPYIAIAVAVIGALGTLGLGALLGPLALLGGYSFSILSLISLASLVMEGMAIPGLFARKASAWKLMYYATLVSAVYLLLRLDIGNLILSTAISLYLLFQVKSYYKN